ncbi:MAG TPA: hypothetical protein VJ932_04045 [Alkalispirochaeta sp.]|nr:hypothetical protein [Alkalispirochaeta sp.]
MNHRRIAFWTLLIMCAVVAGLLFTGCDNPLGEDDDGGNAGDPVVAENGSLTASVSGVPMDLESTTDGDDDLLFAAFVFNAGGDPLDTNDTAENWVAMIAEEIVDGSASGTAFQIVDGARGDEWVGTAGESYDVYYTIYRVTLQDQGPPLKDGAHFSESNPECVCGTVDWQTPVTYQQDGDHSLTSSFESYLDTAHIEFVAQGALGLIGLVMDSLPDGGPPEELGAFDLQPPIQGITVEMTVNDSTESAIDAELVIAIDEYEFTDTGLDPAPTASGNITLSITALIVAPDSVPAENITLLDAAPPVDEEPVVAEMEIGFATTDLTLSQGEDVSVAVAIDGTATDLGAEGFETFTGSFTCDGVEHDLAIMTEVYNIP